METIATIVGVVILAWIPIGPIVGYVVARRGWRIRSPIVRGGGDDEE